MRWLHGTSAAREALLAGGLTVAVELELIHSDKWTVARGVAALLVTVPLLLRLRFPLVVLSLVVGGTALGAALGASPVNGPIFPVIAVLLALSAVGSRTRGVRLAAGAAISFIGLSASSLLASRGVLEALFLATLITGAGLVVGAALGVLRFESERFAERESELTRERDALARAAVADERRRIARELHDVIGHSISVMGVQAGAVRSILHEDQEREREALRAVERTGRQAVGEMRRLIGLLRAEEDSAADPIPSLRRVEQLVSDLRDAGLAVRLSVNGDLAALSPGIDLAGYRILQEALTNALKHAPGAEVEAAISCSANALEIGVVDNGSAAPRTANNHVGHGLVGMRERVALYGGELTTGPTDGGGFAVHARLPLEAS
ncbi:MAG TPA: sensor histidine kinase [Solirubrobacteraceae bacterium]|nr:sensor histidine kinase [Solirubrobacteraceae bacterium]